MNRIAIVGAAGRMGRTLVEAVSQHQVLELTVATESPESGFIGVDAGELAGVGHAGVPIAPAVDAQDADFDVLIDFTRPEATLGHLALCAEKGRRIVIGTTGFSEQQKRTIASAARRIPVVFAPNMSVGVNLCFKLLHSINFSNLVN